MIREMTLGQYYKADSVLHKLDARVKLLGTLLFVITLFFPKSLLSLGIATVFLAFTIKLSKVPFSMMIRGVKPLVIGTSVMTSTTTPNQLTDGLEKGFQFLKKVHIPVHEIAMMMSIALRFIPILTEELDKIMKAQMSRGVDFESGNILERGKKLIPVLVPLFIAAIRRASDLAMAMDARCYNGGEGKTRLHPLVYKKQDYAAYGIMLLYVAIMIFCSFILI